MMQNNNSTIERPVAHGLRPMAASPPRARVSALTRLAAGRSLILTPIRPWPFARGHMRTRRLDIGLVGGIRIEVRHSRGPVSGILQTDILLGRRRAIRADDDALSIDLGQIDELLEVLSAAKARALAFRHRHGAA